VAFNGREALPNVACGPAQNRRTRRGALCIQYKHRKMARSFAGLWPPPPIPTYTVLGNHEREAARTTQLSMVVVSSTERGRTPHVSTSTVTASRRPRGWFRRARRGRKSSASCCERMRIRNLCCGGAVAVAGGIRMETAKRRCGLGLHNDCVWVEVFRPPGVVAARPRNTRKEMGERTRKGVFTLRKVAEKLL
jgi:hypothetical protein